MYGFGRTENNEYAKFLKYMKGRLHISDSYSKEWCNIPAVNNKLAFCFEPLDKGARSDNGDMGNPVYYNIDDPDNLKPENRIIIGVLSNNLERWNNLVLTNVSHYKDWVESIIKTKV